MQEIHLPPALPERIPLHRGLGAKIGLTVLLVELLVLALVAHWQHQSLDRSHDRAFLQRVTSVSALMGRGLLSYETLIDPGYLGPLLGEEPIMAMVLGSDGLIYNAMPPTLVGRNLADLPGMDPTWLQEMRQGVVIRPVVEDGEPRLVCLAPLHATVDRPPFLYVYFKVHTSNIQVEKARMTRLFVLGGGLGVLITSMLLLLIFHRQLFFPIAATARTLRRLEAGDLTARVEGPLRDDQLGALQRGLNAMAQSLDDSVAQLQREIAQRRGMEEQLRQYNETLEQRVLERTRELEDVNRQLLREIASRLDTEDALRESNCQLQGVLDYSPTAIFLLDADHRVILCNVRFATLYGLPDSAVARELAEPQLEALLPAEVAAGILRAQELVRRSGTAHTFEETIPRGDGFATLMTTVFPMRDALGRIWAVGSIATDITDRKRLEAERLRAGQLACLGELAAVVAHEINNPITGIINYSQLLLDDAQGDARPLLAGVIQQAERVAAIVRSLLSYSRVDEEAFAPVEVTAVVEDSLSLSRYRLEREGVQVTAMVEAGLPVVRGRPRELQQVLLNLLSNAQHALMERRRQDPQAVLRCAVRAMRLEDGRVALEVEDTGIGIPQELLPKVMLPFFTTKPQDHGTGLGLSISRTIVEAHGGELTLRNVPGGNGRDGVNSPARGVLARVVLLPWIDKV
ncbi:MAG: PAS domain-containing protein [Desulfovibrio sp.]|nr:PAS domain-containing protein [Desulfovibrio sp.]MCA1986324.1 PAS domain-containing protein [Desulfovibrio sp.]